MNTEEIEEHNNQLKFRRRFDNEHDSLEGEIKDIWADVDTEQAAVALEEDAEDDPFLATELSRDYVEGYAEVEEIPDEEPLSVGLDWKELDVEDGPVKATVSAQESKFNEDLVKKEFAKVGVDFNDLRRPNEFDEMDLVKWWAIITGGIVLLTFFLLALKG